MFLEPHPESEAVFATLARRVEEAVARGRATDRRPPFALVGIGGTAATGKTTLAKRLAEAAGVPAAILSTDGYMMVREERRKLGVTGPNPRSNDLARLARDVQSVARGETAKVLARIETPEGRKSVEQDFAPRPLVIVEGLVALYPQIEARYDLAIFLDGPAEDELSVRLDRDVNERRHPKAEVNEVFWLRQSEYDRFLRPTAKRADVKLWAERAGGRYRLSFMKESPGVG
ncbi:MAG: uridine kinase [Planctomycetota bacterium]